MVNVFEYERMGIPFNNADSKEAVDGGDYELETLRKKLKSHNKALHRDRAKPSDHRTASEIPLIEAHAKAREQGRPSR